MYVYFEFIISPDIYALCPHKWDSHQEDCVFFSQSKKSWLDAEVCFISPSSITLDFSRFVHFRSREC